MLTIILNSRVKKEDQDYKRKVRTTGGGQPPTPPKYTEDMTLAASIMSADLEMAGQAIEIGVPSVSKVDSISPPGNRKPMFSHNMCTLYSIR